MLEKEFMKKKWQENKKRNIVEKRQKMYDHKRIKLPHKGFKFHKTQEDDSEW